MRTVHIAVIAVILLTDGPEAGGQTCCCYAFTTDTTFCPGCGFSWCYCIGGQCPSYSIICNGYKTPVEVPYGVTLAYTETFCKWSGACEPPAASDCVPLENECVKFDEDKVGSMVIPYAWGPCSP